MEEDNNINLLANNINIDSYNFIRIIEDKEKYKNFIKILINSTELNYNKDKLIIHDKYFSDLLKAFFPEDYKKRLNNLIKESEE